MSDFQPDIYDAVRDKEPVGKTRPGLDTNWRVWNGKGYQFVTPTPQQSIDDLVTKFREEYERGFKHGYNAARQLVGGELSEIRDHLMTLTDDDISYARLERMLKSIIEASRTL